MNKIRLNHEISAPTVRLVDLDGSQLGIVSRTEALDRAKEAGYDLAEIAPTASPPVVRILDWGKYRYEQTKQEQRSRKRQKLVEIKEIRLGLKIGEHDLNVKLSQARKFILEGHKVKVSLRFRGREITHPELGRAVLDKAIAILQDVATVEQTAQLTGRDLNVILGISKDAKTKES